jgi:plasmid stabilization system protein ParE
MSMAKQDVERLLNRLPDDSSFEDIQYRLDIFGKVRRGLEDARVNGTFSQEGGRVQPESMAHRVGWSRRALSNLEGADSIAGDSSRYASNVVKKVVSGSQDSRSISGRWRKVPEFDDDNLRELIVYRYGVIYRIQENGVVIAAVIHGKRNVQ